MTTPAPFYSETCPTLGPLAYFHSYADALAYCRVIGGGTIAETTTDRIWRVQRAARPA